MLIPRETELPARRSLDRGHEQCVEIIAVRLKRDPAASGNLGRFKPEKRDGFRQPPLHFVTRDLPELCCNCWRHRGLRYFSTRTLILAQVPSNAMPCRGGSTDQVGRRGTCPRSGATSVS